MLLLWRVLVRGDVFVIDNCTIHKFGDNIGTQDFLFREYGILMVCLPPYHPDFNPTELVFNTTLQRLASKRSRYKCWKIPTKNVDSADTFKECICYKLDSFSVRRVKSFYNKCGYNY